MGTTHKDCSMTKNAGDLIKEFNEFHEKPQSNASRLQKLSHILAQSIPVLTESALLHEGRLNDLDDRQQKTELQVARLSEKEKITEYMTVRALQNITGANWDIPRKGEIGKELSNLCRKYKIERGSTFDKTYGTVYTYPPFILKVWLEQNRYYVPEELRGSYE